MNSTFEKLMFLNKRKKIGTLCCAPFTSMYFGHRGIISACCSNRTKILGTYPEKNLLEIWNSEESNQLRNDLQSFKFGLGCDQCKRLLKTGNFTSLKIPQHDIPGNNYKNLKYPYKLNFELDNKCNLMCIMCHGKYSSKILKYRENKPAYVSPYLTEEFFTELKPFLLNAGSLEFYGGEPFLIDIYLKILDFVSTHNPKVKIYIQSNGTINSQKILNLISSLHINLSISMDSVLKNTYEKIRVGAKYDEVVKNISAFSEILKTNDREFFMSPVLCNLNYTELVDFFNFACKYNMKLYFHDLTTPRELSIYSIEKEQFFININFLKQKISKLYPLTEIENYNLDVIKSQLSHLEYIYNNIVDVYKKNSFSIESFLSINFPNIKQMYLDILAANNINDKVLSKSLIFSSMNEPPENYLFKKIRNLTEEEMKKMLLKFIFNEKELLDRSKN